MFQREGDQLTVRLEGRVDANAAPRFASELERALPGVKSLAIDCGGLRYISSSGLRMLMLAVKTMSRQGKMRIVNVDKDIYEIMETTGFTGVCEVCGKEE